MLLSKKSKLRDVLANPQGKKILETYFSDALKSPMLKMAMGYTLEEIAKKAGPKKIPQTLIDEIDKELRSI